jgi:hypothetical protein
MPRVFEKDGYRFFFYSNDHEPIGLKLRELAKAQQLAEEHRDIILAKWNEHFNR